MAWLLGDDARQQARFSARSFAVLALAVTALGLFLRIEHALTFDGPGRGSDYAVYVQGVRWMLEHWRGFHFHESLNSQVNYQPPLWYAAAALVLKFTESERAIAGLSVIGWLVRQWVLFWALRKAAPGKHGAHLAALSLHAVLPLAVLIDGKVNPEGFHATLFMLALCALWRLDQEVAVSHGHRLRWAAAFGLLAGLSLLTKATSSVLILVALAMMGRRVLSLLLRKSHFPPRQVVGPALLAGFVFALTVGWWCGPNLRAYKHPFPHPWDLATAEVFPDLAKPLMQRRPAEWALPFRWAEYMRFPIIGGKKTPVPNFWAWMVVGTWSDLYNRGFCRLPGKRSTAEVWGGNRGFMPSGPQWSVTLRCVKHFARLAWVGIFLTMAASFAVIHTTYTQLRKPSPQNECGEGRTEGLLVFPLAIFFVLFFVFLFALKYPFDHIAVLNPRYQMAAITPMTLCFGLWLGSFDTRRAVQRIPLLLSALAIAAVAALLLIGRFGN